MPICLQKQTEPSVRNKILYLIQAWSHAFRNEPKYKVVQDTYQIMKVEGEWPSLLSKTVACVVSSFFKIRSETEYPLGDIVLTALCGSG